MFLLDPDILEAGRDLSPAITVPALLIGLFLWLVGAWMHRFWIVLLLTLGAGVYGLLYGPEHGIQPIVAGLLLAVAAGTLGLALMRVLAFVTGGWVLYAAARVIAPAADEPLLCFLVGGLFSVFLFRVWIASVSSVAGTLLIAYSSLWLLGSLAQMDILASANSHGPLWNWGLGSCAVLGILVQFVVHRFYVKKKKAWEEKKAAAAAEAEKAKQEDEVRRRMPLPPPSPPPPPKKGWWPFGGKGKAA
jgi:MFS family permease